jgi:hypothetical protein
MRLTKQDLLGRVLMSLAAVIAGFLPLSADLNSTHVLNPAWPAHARLHEVWLLTTGGLLAIVTLYLIWFYRENRRSGIIMAGVILICVLGGFFTAAATAPLYGGILVDPVTAPMMAFQDIILGVPANSFMFGLGLLVLMIGMVLAWNASRASALAGD